VPRHDRNELAGRDDFGFLPELRKVPQVAGYKMVDVECKQRTSNFKGVLRCWKIYCGTISLILARIGSAPLGNIDERFF
jgi:hypothetical protein